MTTNAHNTTVWSSIRRICLLNSHIEQQGTRLSEHQARAKLQQICPEAEVKTKEYEVLEVTIKC